MGSTDRSSLLLSVLGTEDGHAAVNAQLRVLLYSSATHAPLLYANGRQGPRAGTAVWDCMVAIVVSVSLCCLHDFVPLSAVSASTPLS